jgi:hypothetical protein
VIQRKFRGIAAVPVLEVSKHFYVGVVEDQVLKPPIILWCKRVRYSRQSTSFESSPGQQSCCAFVGFLSRSK